MYEVILFAGTTEGYELCRFLDRHQVSVLACVATEYGKHALEESKYLRITAGRLSEDEMTALFEREQPCMVLDVTHPYAVEVTKNIRRAAESCGLPCHRVLRAGQTRREETDSTAVYVRDTREAVAYLQETEGGIFLTVGSKELEKYTAIKDYQRRLYARVLSSASVIGECTALGLEGSHLMGMQGPFSRELNVAMLRQTGCRYLVTKDSGAAGGLEEKLEAAAECKVTAVVIGRPVQETGISVREARKLLIDSFQLKIRPGITVLGIGMGSFKTLTVEGQKAVKEAELLIGAKRCVEAVREKHHKVFYAYRPEEIRACVDAHPEYERILIALSGDVGFFSGARKLLPWLKDLPVQVLCGVSSVSYFMAKLKMSWEDAKFASLHGRADNLVTLISRNRKVFAILGSPGAVSDLARKLTYYGMGNVLLYVGENLSYESEQISCRRAKEWIGYEGTALSVVCAVHEDLPGIFTTHGLPDAGFQRGKVPMTKAEVRAVSLSKLCLKADAVCYDIGAGTGSVAVEMARCVPEGKVFAIERTPEGCALIRENQRIYAADHLEVICGTAPEALEDLIPATHAFIGGSSGRLQKIVELLLRKNPDVRIVINCITLETLTKTLEILKSYSFSFSEIVQVSAARTRTAGDYHMLMGENPVFIVTCQNPHREEA